MAHTEVGPRGVPRGALAYACERCAADRDLSWLRCPRRISPSDVDGLFFAADGDRVLFFEFKRHNAPFEKGQRWALEVLARKPGIDVLLIRGTPARPVGFMWCRGGTWGAELPADRDSIQNEVDEWFDA